jgi:hypothetical protein
MTMANAPLWDGTAGDIEVIWVKREAEYFCKWGWTGFSDLPVRLNHAFTRALPDLNQAFECLSLKGPMARD